MTRAVLMAMLLWPAANVVASSDDFDFDIMVEEGRILVWIDVGSLLSAGQIDELHEGTDLAFEIELNLAVPRKILGDHSVFSTSEILRLRYHIVTQTFSCRTSVDSTSKVNSFVSAEQMIGHLSDSLLFDLLAVDELDPDERYVLKMKVSRHSVTSALDSKNTSDSLDTPSPLQQLFGHFLKWTSFGRKDFHAESRPISLSELTGQ